MSLPSQTQSPTPVPTTIVIVVNAIDSSADSSATPPNYVALYVGVTAAAGVIAVIAIATLYRYFVIRKLTVPPDLNPEAAQQFYFDAKPPFPSLPLQSSQPHRSPSEQRAQQQRQAPPQPISRRASAASPMRVLEEIEVEERKSAR